MKLSLLIFLVLFAINGGAQSTTVFFHLDKINIKDKIVLDSNRVARYKEQAVEQVRLNGYVGVKLKDSIIKKDVTHYYYTYDLKFNSIKLINTSSKRGQSKEIIDFNFVIKN